MNINNFTIISFYQFRQLKNIKELKIFFSDYCNFNKIRGTVILAPEGINGMLAGFDSSIKKFEQLIIAKGFKNLDIKYSFYKFMPFSRLKIKSKKAIIKFPINDLNVEKSAGKYISPIDWNKLIKKKDVLLLDVRNQFENDIGTFKNSLNPQIKNFSSFKNFVDKKLKDHKNKKIAMFCTGGIRCEKASSYMLKKGFKNLFQLKGGILKYLERISKKKSMWNGECFVFDSRVTVKHKLTIGSYELCHGCRTPLNKKDTKSKKYKKGITCHNCFDTLSKEKKIKLKERNKQIKIAKKRGLYNPYLKLTPTNFL